MYVVRPADFSDLAPLERLARESGMGITNFPANRERINDKIAASQRSFGSTPQYIGDESYLFVLEELQSQTIVGTCSIDAMVGVETPFYNYRIDEVVHASPQLQIHNRIPALFLCHDYSGTSRLSSLVIDSEHATRANIELLSRSRLMFIAQHLERFTPKVFAEIRGESDQKGHSPFWEALGRHFFSMDFQKADYLSGIRNKHFIAELMPRYPIYIPTLSEDAQDCIGVIHGDSENIAEVLLEEGFKFRDYVDIFDAGPCIEARVQDIKTVSSCIHGSACFEQSIDSNQQYLIATKDLKNFRVTISPAESNSFDLILPINLQEVLSISPGNAISWSKIKS
ncbi:arginine N-succinyltransferase [Terasakiispira papahanaumokuakeensis]|uniref:Arginine N-succinyltransferase n=1 Tax=Terasakiispira papahanaumokuakeensis TaxID=197479 RepID=A0A1E2V834_9GAMM|nr:arginine N-succinyltransferase [Terasakiispira papahanaumokuakeensis]ODC02815.1 arginine N-succinyltransferase [Terasakiispira papahanaumokuakeensis]